MIANRISASPRTVSSVSGAQWGCDGFQDRPVCLESPSDQIAISSETFRPLRISQSFSVVGNVAISSSIIGLLRSCGPAAIIRGIRAVIVFSVNGATTFWRKSHIGKKVFEIMPSLADCYSPCAVILISMAFRIVAALHNVLPSVKNRRFCESVRGVCFVCVDLFHAATAKVSSAFKSGGVCPNSISAITPDEVSSARCVGLWLMIQNNQFSKSCPSG